MAVAQYLSAQEAVMVVARYSSAQEAVMVVAQCLSHFAQGEQQKMLMADYAFLPSLSSAHAAPLPVHKQPLT